MRSIGFNNATIGIMVAVYSVVMLAVDTPSGILADRWSRKGVLILASICLAFSALAGGLSHGVRTYLVCAVLWGVFYACYSGMYDSILYDTLAEEAGNKLYDHFLGRIQLLDSIGLVISSILGALIAAHSSLRLVYFLTIPFVLLSVIALIKFEEPVLHKQHSVIPLSQQLKDTFKAIAGSRYMLSIVLILILRSAIIFCIYEFAQLWLLALNTPTAYFGIANAALLSSVGVGGILVSRLKLSRHIRMLPMLVLMLLSSLGLIYFRNIVGIVVSQFLFASSLISIYVIFSRLLHDMLPSSIRAGASSATNSLGRLAVIPMALLIGFVSQKYSIYKAAYILFVLAILITIFILLVSRRNNYTGLEPNYTLEFSGNKKPLS